MGVAKIYLNRYGFRKPNLPETSSQAKPGDESPVIRTLYI